MMDQVLCGPRASTIDVSVHSLPEGRHNFIFGAGRVHKCCSNPDLLDPARLIDGTSERRL
jgi:hypothetical protein